MTLLDIAAILLTTTAVFGFINTRFFKLESSVGMMLMALVSSLIVLLVDKIFPGSNLVLIIRSYISGIDFNKALMEGMLGFLLFAGALHADLEYFSRRKWTIGLLATVGLLTSTVIVAFASKGLFMLLGFDVSTLACLIFGALISPTDPIAVMGILKTLNAPPSLEAKIAGESLFNDGVAVVVFTGLVALLPIGSNHHAPGASGMAMLFVQEVLGGVLLGLVAGWLAYKMMLVIDDYRVEVLTTLALVTGGYSLAHALHVSGPIAMVCAGLLIGNRGKRFAMSEEVTDYLEKFWELIDEILNAVLFLLIGAEVLVVAFSGSMMLAGIGAIAIVLVARITSVSLPISLMRNRVRFTPGAIRILTWAGLRGGISVALALSLPDIPEKPLILACTYIVVLFSVIVQGLTIKKVLKKFV